MGIVLRIRRLGFGNQFYPNYCISLGMCLRYFQVIFYEYNEGEWRNSAICVDPSPGKA